MTCKELIKVLENHPPEMNILLKGYEREGPFLITYDLADIEEVEVVKRINPKSKDNLVETEKHLVFCNRKEG